jgi:hypothetical protein
MTTETTRAVCAYCSSPDQVTQPVRYFDRFPAHLRSKVRETDYVKGFDRLCAKCGRAWRPVERV